MEPGPSEDASRHHRFVLPPPAQVAPFDGLLTRCEEVEAPAALPTAPRAYGFDRVEVRPWPARVALWL